jgi:hypothetical protein
MELERSERKYRLEAWIVAWRMGGSNVLKSIPSLGQVFWTAEAVTVMGAQTYKEARNREEDF